MIKELTFKDGNKIFEEKQLSCSPTQIRIALSRAGLLDRVKLIASLDAECAIAWEYATVIIRDSPFISRLAGVSGMTEEEIDSIFLDAMAL